MVKVVIIDFDDTLCLTEEAAFRSENEAAIGMGFSPMARSAHQKNWGKPLKDAIVERIPGIDADEFMKRVEKVIEDYAFRGILDSLTKENLDTLNVLKKAGKKLAIVTSRSLAEAKHLLHESHPLGKTVEAFYHRDNSDYLKPDPRVFNQVLKQFNVLPQECVYIGDNINDAIAANGAKIPFIAVLESGLKTKQDFANQNVDFFAAKFTQVAEYILKRN